MSSTKIKTGTKTQSSMTLSSECEKMINNLINVFFASAYRCKSITYYYECPTVGLFGLANIHRWSAISEVMFARGLMEYLKVRGGRVVLKEIPEPKQVKDQLEFLVVEPDGTPCFESVSETSKKDTEFVVESINCLLLGKRAVYDYLLKVYEKAWEEFDPHLTDFLETNFIRPIANVNRKLGILQSQAILACEEESVGVYEFNMDVEKNLLKIMTVNKLVRPDKWSTTF